jgi:hypothetical protein
MNIQLSPQDQDLLQHNWTGLASKHITYAKASIGDFANLNEVSYVPVIA